MDVKGIELALDAPPNPIATTPGLAFTLGGAQVDGCRVIWIAIRIDP